MSETGIEVRGAFAVPIVIDETVEAVLEFFSEDVEPVRPDIIDFSEQVRIQLENALHRQCS